MPGRRRMGVAVQGLGPRWVASQNTSLGSRGNDRLYARRPFSPSRSADCPRSKMYGCRCPSAPNPACRASPPPPARRALGRYPRARRRGVGYLHRHCVSGICELPSRLCATSCF